MERLTAVIREKDKWIDPEQWHFKGVFSMEGAPDALLDKGVINDELYLLMGTREMNIPKLSELGEDMLYLVRNIAGKDVGIETSAIEYLKAHEWTRDYEELEGLVRKAVELSSGSVISGEILMDIVGSNSKSTPKNTLRHYIERRCQDFAQFVYLLNDEDKAKTAEQLGVSKANLNKVLEPT